LAPRVGQGWNACSLHTFISASSFERNWFAHGHINSKIRNSPPEITKKPVYVYSHRKMAANTWDIEALKMFAWDNEDVSAPNELTAGSPSSLLL
jgi:hypothetical protein